MKKNYWILIGTLLILTSINLKSSAQTVAKFTDSSYCYGDQTKFTSTSTSTYTIKSYYWDLDNDGVFNNDSGAIVKYLFSFADTFKVGLKVISTNDTSIVYQKVVIQLVTPFFTKNADSLCLTGNSFSFTNATTLNPGGTFSSKWYFDDGATSTSFNTSHSYTKDGTTFQVKLITTTNFGCKDSSIIGVTVLPNPKVSFSVMDTVNCIGENFQFTNKSSIAYGSMSNVWVFSNGNQFTLHATNNFPAVGTYPVTLKVTSNKGCSDSFKRNVYVDSNLIAGFIVSPNDTQCWKGNSFTFASVSNVCGTADSILWDLDGDGVFGDQKGTSVNKSYLTSQTVKVGMIVFSGIKSDTAYHTVVIHPNPVAGFSINIPSQILTGNYFAFTNSSTPTPASLLSNWDFGDGNSSLNTSPSWSYATAGTFKVTLTVTTNMGCVDTISKIATVTNPLTVDFIADTVCLKDSTSFINKSTSGSPMLQINWDFNNDLVFTDGSGNNVKHKFLTPGTYTVGLQIITAALTDTVFKSVVVYPKPVAGFTINTPIQSITGNKFVFTNTSSISPSGTLSYLWDFKDASTSILINDTHTYAATGNYFVFLTATSQFGCTDTISKKATVIANSILSADFTTDTICFPGITTFTNTTNSTYPLLQINWDLDSNGLFDNGTGAVVNYGIITNGNFIAGLQVITAYDTSVIYKTVVVNPKPKADFSINRVSQPLSGNNFIFLNASKISPFSLMTYKWTTGDGGSSTAIDVTHSYAAMGTYDVQIVATSDKGCRDSIIKQVNVVSFKLTPDFSSNNACLGDTVFFTNLSSVTNDSIINFLWNFGDGSTIVRGNPKHLYSTTGSYNVTLIALLLSGNKDSIVKSITIYPSPVVNINTVPNSTVYTGQSVKLSLTGIYDSIMWSTGSKDSSIVVAAAGIYSVKVIDVNGCKDSASTEIFILPKTPINVVNAFTPNGDGINDVWKITNIDIFGKCAVKIFNRWGDLMYSSSDYKNNWDGKRNGEVLPEGSYYYLIYTPNDGSYTGPINILR